MSSTSISAAEYKCKMQYGSNETKNPSYIILKHFQGPCAAYSGVSMSITPDINKQPVCTSGL